jgi:hypothetical protein
VAHLVRLLATGCPAPQAEAACEPGRADPAGFRAACFEALPLLGQPAAKSVPGGPTDLYADLVERWRPRGAPAAWFPAEGRRLSLEQLHGRASALARAWRALGMDPGQGVALVMPMGEGLLVSLLAAFQAGLCATFVPPRGARFVQRALAAVEPAAVCSPGRYAGLLGTWAGRALPLEAPPPVPGAPETARSHVYAPGEPALRLLSPFSVPAWAATPLTAEAVLWGAARDALFVYGLQPGERLALPGFDPLQWQPCGVLAALFAGAEWVEVEEAAAVPDEPPPWGPHVLGVTPGVRARLLSSGRPLPGLRRWLKDPTQPYDWAAWDILARRFSDSVGARGINAWGSASAGGVQLFCVPPAKGADLALWPVPGQPFLLEDYLGGGVPALGGTGIYAPIEGVGDGALGRVALSRTAQGTTYAGCMDVPVGGQRYPMDAVEAVARSVPGVREAVSWVQASPELLNAAHTTLLLFLDLAVPGAAPDAGNVERAVAREVGVQLGAGAVPVSVRAFAVEPRRLAEGGVDASWCRFQAQGGGLDARARDGLSRDFTLARQWAGKLAVTSEDR